MESAVIDAEFRIAEIQYAVGREWDRTVAIDGRTLVKPPPPMIEDESETTPEPDAPPPEPVESPDPQGIPQEGFSTDLGETDYFLFAEWNREPLAPGPHRIEVDLSGDALLLGVDLRSGEPGILYDALGINGSEMADLDAWEPGVRADLLLHASPALIVVSFGTNDMGAKGFDAEAYFAACLGVLQRLRADAPDAAVLVTGPAERGGKHRQTRARMLARSEACSDALRSAALDAGCAFWDARAAMGGRGSIARWAAAGLARTDQVHLTESGYRALARLLFDALMGAYEKGPALTEVPLLPLEPPPP
jgi:lysophospholipase L1-like esterase